MSDHSPYSDRENDIEEDQIQDFGGNLQRRRLFNSSELVLDDDGESTKKQRDAENLTALHMVLPPINDCHLTDATGNNTLPANIQINAQLRGRFSQSEDNNAATTCSSQQQQQQQQQQEELELIFYRRNKFKVLGSVSIPEGTERVRVVKTGALLRITSLHADLDAIESLEGGAVRLLQSLSKDKVLPDRKTNDDSLCKKLDLAFRTPASEGRKSVPVAWEKLQFRHATAKKRGTWQYFYLRVTVSATLEDGSSLVLCRAQSAAITVRGRSPQSFPDTNKRMNNRSVKQMITAIPDTSNNSNNNKDMNNADPPFPIDCGVTVSDSLLFYDFSDLGIWNEALQWHDESKDGDSQEYSGVTMPSSLNESNSSNNNNDLFIPSVETSLLPSIPDLGSIFSLPNPLSTMSMDNMHLFQDVSASTAVSTNSHKENAEEEDSEEEERSTYSYEYIPLSINDWTVPVDAVYRPHGVHARKVPNTGQSVAKKRYFMAVS